MPRPRRHDIDIELLGLLATASEGLSASELRSRLSSRPSQPTLSRRLTALRAAGKVVVRGLGPATRYHVASGNELPKLRSRLLHEHVARKLVREPDLVERARVRLAFLQSKNPSARAYHRRWMELIEGPRDALLRALSEDSESAADLRQESPFSTLLAPSEREQVLGQLGGRS